MIILHPFLTGLCENLLLCRADHRKTEFYSINSVFGRKRNFYLEENIPRGSLMRWHHLCVTLQTLPPPELPAKSTIKAYETRHLSKNTEPSGFLEVACDLGDVLFCKNLSTLC